MKVSLILLLFFTGISAWASNRPFVSTNVLSDFEEQLKEEVFFYSEKLGLGSDVSIRVNLSLKLPKGFRGTISYQQVGEEKSQVLITLDRRQARSDLLMTLAHEMVHAWQKVKGHLVVLDSKNVRWRCENIALSRMKYEDRPWEKEADEMAIELRRAFLLTQKESMLFII